MAHAERLVARHLLEGCGPLRRGASRKELTPEARDAIRGPVLKLEKAESYLPFLAAFLAPFFADFFAVFLAAFLAAIFKVSWLANAPQRRKASPCRPGSAKNWSLPSRHRNDLCTRLCDSAICRQHLVYR